MTKKRSKKDKEIIEQNEMESVENNIPETEPESNEVDPGAVDVSQQGEEDVESEVVDESLEEVSSEDDEFSPDDLLDDVRRSLIEENAKVEEAKKPSLWQRLGRRKRGTKDTDESASETDVTPDEAVVSGSGDLDTHTIEAVDEQQDDADESIDELIEMLETEEEATPGTGLVPEPVQVEERQPEVEKVDVGELKKRAFRGRTPDDEDENFSDVRAVALEGDEEVFVEVEVKAEDTVEDRIKSLENALRPYRRYIYFSIAFIGIVVIVATSALLYGAYRDSLPQEPVKEISTLPYPVALNIPGGLSFNLGRGSLDNGNWNPRRPEWLEGTEICRWIAIPYSRQLEAVVRTLTRDDQLELVMSNSDHLKYDVFSITQMSIENMQEVSSNTPCLLLVLADANTDTRWVVTAYP